MRCPSYLYSSRHGVFYVRWPVPVSLHPHGRQGWVRMSLKTRDPNHALLLSRSLSYVAIIGKGGNSRPSFRLFDPRKNFAELRLNHRRPTRNPPRIHFFGSDPRVAALWPAPRPAVVAEPVPPPDGLVDAARLARRLEALESALNDLPRQARRLARWRVRRENVPSLKFKSPLRPGPPPGHRRKPVHEVDEVLIDCHGLARDALRLDTS